MSSPQTVAQSITAAINNVTPITEARKRSAGRGKRKPSRRFGGLPFNVWQSPEYEELSGNAVKLLMDFACQYNGYNNGNLTAAFSVLKARGWRSKSTLAAAIKELLSADLILRTREGRFHRPGGCCALFALSWNAIDDMPGLDLEVGPTNKPHRVFGPRAIKPSAKSSIASKKPRDARGRYVKGST